MQSDSDKASLDRRQRAPAHAEARLKERGARHVGTLESLLPEAGCNLPRLDIWQSSSGSSLWQVIPVHLCLSLNPRNYLFQATPTHMHHVTIQTRRTALLTESPWQVLITYSITFLGDFSSPSLDVLHLFSSFSRGRFSRGRFRRGCFS